MQGVEIAYSGARGSYPVLMWPAAVVDSPFEKRQARAAAVMVTVQVDLVASQSAPDQAFVSALIVDLASWHLLIASPMVQLLAQLFAQLREASWLTSTSTATLPANVDNIDVCMQACSVSVAAATLSELAALRLALTTSGPVSQVTGAVLDKGVLHCLLWRISQVSFHASSVPLAMEMGKETEEQIRNLQRKYSHTDSLPLSVRGPVRTQPTVYMAAMVGAWHLAVTTSDDSDDQAQDPVYLTHMGASCALLTWSGNLSACRCTLGLVNINVTAPWAKTLADILHTAATAWLAEMPSSLLESAQPPPTADEDLLLPVGGSDRQIELDAFPADFSLQLLGLVARVESVADTGLHAAQDYHAVEVRLSEAVLERQGAGQRGIGLSLQALEAHHRRRKGDAGESSWLPAPAADGVLIHWRPDVKVSAKAASVTLLSDDDGQARLAICSAPVFLLFDTSVLPLLASTLAPLYGLNSLAQASSVSEEASAVSASDASTYGSSVMQSLQLPRLEIDMAALTIVVPAKGMESGEGRTALQSAQNALVVGLSAIRTSPAVHTAADTDEKIQVLGLHVGTANLQRWWEDRRRRDAGLTPTACEFMLSPVTLDGTVTRPVKDGELQTDGEDQDVGSDGLEATAAVDQQFLQWYIQLALTAPLALAVSDSQLQLVTGATVMAIQHCLAAWRTCSNRADLGAGEGHSDVRAQHPPQKTEPLCHVSSGHFHRLPKPEASSSAQATAARRHRRNLSTASAQSVGSSVAGQLLAVAISLGIRIPTISVTLYAAADEPNLAWPLARLQLEHPQVDIFLGPGLASYRGTWAAVTLASILPDSDKPMAQDHVMALESTLWQCLVLHLPPGQQVHAVDIEAPYSGALRGRVVVESALHIEIPHELIERANRWLAASKQSAGFFGSALVRRPANDSDARLGAPFSSTAAEPSSSLQAVYSVVKRLHTTWTLSWRRGIHMALWPAPTLQLETDLLGLMIKYDQQLVIDARRWQAQFRLYQPGSPAREQDTVTEQARAAEVQSARTVLPLILGFDCRAIADFYHPLPQLNFRPTLRLKVQCEEAKVRQSIFEQQQFGMD